MSIAGADGCSELRLTVSNHQLSTISYQPSALSTCSGGLMMSRSRMLLGGVVLVLLLGGIGVFQGCRNAAPPAAVVVTRYPAPESRSAAAVGLGRGAQPAP